MKSIAVTGASGFVGSSLCAELFARGFSVRALVRRRTGLLRGIAHRIQIIEVGEICGLTRWRPALVDVDCVIHCAGRAARATNESDQDLLAAYRVVNVEGTKRLAEEAVELGVKRLVFLSSVKVNGEQTASGSPFTSSNEVAPQDAYGQSKWEAEDALHRIALRSGLEIVIIRPPLVYGPGVKGNMRRLLGLVRSGMPLPFGAVHNHRALVGLGNLLDLMVRCVDHPDAAGQTFLVADEDDLSTPDLLRRLAIAMGRPARLLPVPLSLLRAAALLFNRSEEADRLLNSLEVDIRHTRQVLQWSPPFHVDHDLKRMIDDAFDPRI